MHSTVERVAVHNDDAGDMMYNTLLKHAGTVPAGVPVDN
jgi:hypothetical protein